MYELYNTNSTPSRCGNHRNDKFYAYFSASFPREGEGGSAGQEEGLHQAEKESGNGDARHRLVGDQGDALKRSVTG